MKLINFRNIISVLSSTSFVLLTACGGGGSTPSNNPPDATTPTTPVSNTTPTTPEIGGDTKTGGNVVITPDPTPANNTSATPAVPNAPEASQPVVYSANDAEIIANVKSSNIDYSPGYSGRGAGTWRWQGTSVPHVSVYLPIPANTQEVDYADKVKASVTLINLKMKGALILEVTNFPVVTNYIQISYNTSYVPSGFTDYVSGNYCANVSTGPYSGNPINPDWQNAISSYPVYLNVGNGKCNVTQDVIVHEFGHALGLENHFKGFGIGPAISDEYWDTLATLYGNPQSTTVTNMVVKRISK